MSSPQPAQWKGAGQRGKWGSGRVKRQLLHHHSLSGSSQRILNHRGFSQDAPLFMEYTKAFQKEAVANLCHCCESAGGFFVVLGGFFDHETQEHKHKKTRINGDGIEVTEVIL